MFKPNKLTNLPIGHLKSLRLTSEFVLQASNLLVLVIDGLEQELDIIFSLLLLFSGIAATAIVATSADKRSKAGHDSIFHSLDFTGFDQSTMMSDESRLSFYI